MVLTNNSLFYIENNKFYKCINGGARIVTIQKKDTFGTIWLALMFEGAIWKTELFLREIN